MTFTPFTPEKCPRCGEYFTPKTIKNDKCKCMRLEDKSWNKRKRIPPHLLQKWADMKAEHDIKRGWGL
jgi:hypothetical protein